MLRTSWRDASWVGSKVTAKQPSGRKPVTQAVSAVVETLEGRTLLSAGQLDTTFGNNGQFLLPAAGYIAEASAVQSDGKVLIVGSAPSSSAASTDFFVERLNPDGTPDSSFATDGIKTEHFADPVTATAVAIQGDGKIVVGGVDQASSTDSGFAFMRLNTNGTLDSTFGSGTGVDVVAMSGTQILGSIAIESDGKILAVGRGGYTESGGLSATDAFVVTRLTTGGALDTTLGNQGFVIEQLPSFDLNEAGTSITIAAATGGKFYVGGSIQFDPVIWRFNNDGSLDTSFASGGVAWNPLQFEDTNDDYESATISQMIVQPDGKLLVSGLEDIGATPDQDWFVGRFNSDGSVDTGFGDKGLSPEGGTASIRFQAARSVGSHPTMALQSDGKIVIGGAQSDAALVVYRLTASGQPDADFTTAAIDGPSSSGGLLLEPDNRIVLVGNASSGATGTQIELARLQNDVSGTPPVTTEPTPPAPTPGQLNPSYGFEGRAVLPDPVQTWLGGQQLTIAASAVQSDGKVIVVGATLAGGGSFLAERFNADGTLDPSFNAGALGNLFLGQVSQATSVVVQPDGKILIGGYTEVNASGAAEDAAFALVRLNSDGTLDTSFGTGGEVTINFAGNEQIDSLALYSNGDIVAAGTFFEYPDAGFHIVRLNSAGALETAFNGAGYLTVNLGAAPSVTYPTALALQADGKLLIGTHTGGNASVLRYNQDGAIDTTFGSNGVAVQPDTDFIGGSVNSLAVLPDGAVLAAAADLSYNGGPDAPEILLFRLTSTGQADTTFGMGGAVSVYDQLQILRGPPGSSKLPPYYKAVALLPQTNGSVIVVGTEPWFDQGEYLEGQIPLIRRFNGDGSIDSTFAQDFDPAFEPQPYFQGQEVRGAMQKADGSLFVAADVYADNATSSPHVVGVADYVTGSLPVVSALPASTLSSGSVVSPPTTPIGTPTTPTNPSTPTTPTTPTIPSAPSTPIAGSTPLPAGQLTAVVASSTPARAIGGARGIIVVKIKNAGSTTFSGPITIDIYASTDSIPSTDDAKLTTLTLSSLTLKPGKTRNVRVPFNVTSDIATGKYLLLANVTETSQGTAAFTAATKHAMAITAATVDLSIKFAPTKTLKLKTGKTAKAVLLIKNTGNIKAVGTYSINLAASTDATLSIGDDSLTNLTDATLKLAAKGSRRVTISFNPASSLGSTYDLIATLTSSTTPQDVNATNNAAVVAVKVS